MKNEVAGLMPTYLEKLKQLVRIPSISFEGYDQKIIYESADLVEALLREIGAENVQKLIPKSRNPAVFGELKAGETNPTVLLYAHHDVQPTMRLELWDSPPFEPEIRGDRLYGRGTADDKAGIVIHLAAAELAKRHFGAKAPNLKFIIEGEEESGSECFADLLKEHKDLLSCDAVIIADLGNFSKGTPTLTTTLRGMGAIEVELRAMKAPLHSGTWSGPIPDPAQALCKLIASLTDDAGNIAIEGFCEGLAPATELEKTSYKTLGLTEQIFRAQAKILDGVKLTVPESEICEALWRRPSLVVTAMEAGNRKQAGNVLQESAYARIGVRIAPGMDTEKAVEKLVNHLKAHVPSGLELNVKEEAGANPFTTDTSHPFFKAMTDAMKAAFGREAKFIGCGASIPGAETFRNTFGEIPILLLGVEDPECNAHGENEGLYLPDFEKTIVAETLFFGELAK